MINDVADFISDHIEALLIAYSCLAWLLGIVLVRAGAKAELSDLDPTDIRLAAGLFVAAPILLVPAVVCLLIAGAGIGLKWLFMHGTDKLGTLLLHGIPRRYDDRRPRRMNEV